MNKLHPICQMDYATSTGTRRQVSGLFWRLRRLALLHKFLASRLQLPGQLGDHRIECPDVDAMKLPIVETPKPCGVPPTTCAGRCSGARVRHRWWSITERVRM